MSMWNVRPLSELIEPDVENVEVSSDDEYKIAGVYSFGRGLFQRGPISGTDTSYKTLHRLRTSQLVVSRLKAFEGALAIVPYAFDGWFLSPEFPTFRCVDGQLDAGYLRHICRWPEFWSMLATTSKGIGARRERVHTEHLLRLELGVPSIEEQRHIAARLDRVTQHASATIDAQMSARRLDTALVDSAVWRIIERGIASGWLLRTLGDIAEINPRPDRLDPEESVTFVPMAIVDQYAGSIKSSAEVRRVETVGPGYKQFKRGDIIFARITPCMQNGKTAIFDGVTDYGYGSTEFHVIRPGSEVRAQWLHRFLRTQEFRNLAAQRLKGTAGQQRVSAEFLRTASIPTPPEFEQDKVLLAIDRLLERGSALALSRAKASALAAAIEPAMINQAFAELS